MHDPSTNALTVILFGLAGVFLFYAGSLWIRLAKERERADEQPVIPVRALRSAAGVTGVAFYLLGAAMMWFAAASLP